MIIILCAIFGGLLGALRARKRGGSRADIAQYVAVHAIALGIVGLVITVILARNLAP